MLNTVDIPHRFSCLFKCKTVILSALKCAKWLKCSTTEENLFFWMEEILLKQVSSGLWIQKVTTRGRHPNNVIWMNRIKSPISCTALQLKSIPQSVQLAWRADMRNPSRVFQFTYCANWDIQLRIPLPSLKRLSRADLPSDPPYVRNRKIQ